MVKWQHPFLYKLPLIYKLNYYEGRVRVIWSTIWAEKQKFVLFSNDFVDYANTKLYKML